MIAANAGCGTSAFADEKIYFMEYGVDKLARFDVETQEIIDTLAETGAYYGLIDDKLNQRLIATYTDFFSQGTAYLLTYDGQIINSFDVGVSPGSIVLDVRMVSGVGVEDADDGGQIMIYPNPTSSWLTIEAEQLINSATLTSATGQVLFQNPVREYNSRINIQSYPPGMYLLTLQMESGDRVVRKVIHE